MDGLVFDCGLRVQPIVVGSHGSGGGRQAGSYIVFAAHLPLYSAKYPTRELVLPVFRVGLLPVKPLCKQCS